MNDPQSLRSPTQLSDRLLLIDALRGAALWGIFLVNITAMGDSWYQGFPRDPQDISDPSWGVWIVTNIFFKDTMRALFSMLFGAGILLMNSRSMNLRIFIRRNIFLVIFGLIHATVLLWGYEILFVYGISALLCLRLRDQSSRGLLIWSLSLLVLFSMFSSIGGIKGLQTYNSAQEAIELRSTGTELDEGQQTAIDNWIEQRDKRNPPLSDWQRELETRQGGYVENLQLSAKQFYGFQIAGEESIFIFLETIATIIFGMWLFSVNIINGLRDESFYIKLCIYGYAIGLPLRAFATWGMWQSGIVPPVGYDLVIYEPARIATTLGHIGLFVIVFKRFQRGVIWLWFAKMGQAALTNYVGQSVIAALLFYGFGFGLFGALDWLQLTLLGITILIGQSLFSVYWLRRYRYGPLEWLWRSLTYSKIQSQQLSAPKN